MNNSQAFEIFRIITALIMFFIYCCFMAIVILVVQTIYILDKMQLLHEYKDKKEAFNALLEAIRCGLLAVYTDNKNLKTNSGCWIFDWNKLDGLYIVRDCNVYVMISFIEQIAIMIVWLYFVGILYYRLIEIQLHLDF